MDSRLRLGYKRLIACSFEKTEKDRDLFQRKDFSFVEDYSIFLNRTSIPLFFKPS
ncbi:MAG: hypothetical protein BWX51_01393 [Bacteroidetes bacterium ADurb.Bin012]|jgi:hypothetical protein|nr:MAG: hypothetical protein BWX51_01393 [Bacteroidetes bacterium ADurb.Bin012]